MSKLKGITAIPDLMFFMAVIIITLSIVYILSIVPMLDKVIAIRAEALFQSRQDDRGTALVAFLKTNIGKGSYAEKLGEQAAIGVPSDSSTEMRETLKKIDPKNPGRIEVYYENKNIWKSDYVGDIYISADLALPGLKKGEVRVL